MSKTLLLILLILGFKTKVDAQTSISGGNVSGTWSLTKSPYKISGNILIPDGSTLTIEPGVEILFQGHYKLFCNGRIVAKGTSTLPILFTAVDTTIGWVGLRFDGTSTTNDTSFLKNCIFSYGRVVNSISDNQGGAIYFNNFSKCVIDSSNFVNNYALYGGGAIYCTYSSPIITYSYFKNNKANNGGDGIELWYGSSPNLRYNTFIGCGIYAYNSYSEIYNNYFKGSRQGALTCFNSPITFLRNIVDSNYNDNGGGGGGVLAYSSGINILNNIFKRNYTLNGGGAITLYDGSGNVIANNLIVNNAAGNLQAGATFGGGAIHCRNSSPYIINNTICNNYSITNGGGLTCDLNSNPSIRNTIFFNNRTLGNVENIFLTDNGSDPSINYCLLQGGVNGINTNGNPYTGNNSNILDTSPDFIDTTTGNFALLSTSICIDGGDLNSLSISVPIYDLATNPRIVNSTIDIGAYEYQGLLPLKLLSFYAKLQTPNSVALNWQTANEVNVSHFNIQRSNNGKDFTGIGKVNASCCSYEFQDSPPLEGLGVVYYRLEMVDKDGSKTYSEVRQLAIDNKQMAINIYPNPAKDFVTIECKGAKELLIIDYLGKEVYRKKIIKNQESIMNVQRFSKGIYIVKVMLNNGDVKTEKLLVE